MRTLVLSDIHGSAFACKMALSYLDKLKCDRIFLLPQLRKQKSPHDNVRALKEALYFRRSCFAFAVFFLGLFGDIPGFCQGPFRHNGTYKFVNEN